jgi:hypothetical protein
VRVAGVAVTVDEKIVNVTGMVCAGTLDAELETMIEPV